MRSAFRNLSSEVSLDEIADSLAGLPLRDLDAALRDWQLWGREDQFPPAGDGAAAWRTWLILGGRGAGKTRTGAEWIRSVALARPARIALVGETLSDVRSVMIEGVSGLLAVHAERERPRFEASKQQLVWPNGTIAQMFSAEDPDSLRGPQFAAAWCDEIAKWRYAERTWDMLQFALRLGTWPRQVVTTTPRPLPILQQILDDPSTVTSRVRTIDNGEHLAPTFIAEMVRRYAGTVLGRQELDGELVSENSGALWRSDWIEQQRVAVAPEPARRPDRGLGA